MKTKIKLKANFDEGTGSLGNLSKWRDSHSVLLRADILQDWMYLIEDEYLKTLDLMSNFESLDIDIIENYIKKWKELSHRKG